MATQTDSCEMQDFEVQVNRERAYIAIQHQEVQTIKTEIVTPNIPMPNIPTSVNQNPSKKRKRSSSRSTTPTQNDSGTTDPSILNSEVYKIYCRNQDPKEARKQIKNMKNCLAFKEPFLPLPEKEVWKKSCEKFLKNLWCHGNCGKSKWEQIQAFLNHDIEDYEVSSYNDPIPLRVNDMMEEHTFSAIMYDSFTEIKVLLSHGIEYWYVENFDGGVEGSKWYRGVCCDSSVGCAVSSERLAMLKMLGLEDSSIEKYHYEFLEKKSQKIDWLKFAEMIARYENAHFRPDPSIRGYISLDYV